MKMVTYMVTDVLSVMKRGTLMRKGDSYSDSGPLNPNAINLTKLRDLGTDTATGTYAAL